MSYKCDRCNSPINPDKAAARYKRSFPTTMVAGWGECACGQLIDRLSMDKAFVDKAQATSTSRNLGSNLLREALERARKRKSEK